MQVISNGAVAVATCTGMVADFGSAGWLHCTVERPVTGPGPAEGLF